jgi:hypothetical protein
LEENFAMMPFAVYKPSNGARALTSEGPRGMMRLRTSLLVVMVVCLAPSAAWAYVGPGASLSVMGAALALVASLFLMIAGFVWYPIKRLIGLRRRVRESRGDSTAETAS